MPPPPGNTNQPRGDAGSNNLHPFLVFAIVAIVGIVVSLAILALVALLGFLVSEQGMPEADAFPQQIANDPSAQFLLTTGIGLFAVAILVALPLPRPVAANESWVRRGVVFAASMLVVSFVLVALLPMLHPDVESPIVNLTTVLSSVLLAGILLRLIVALGIIPPALQNGLGDLYANLGGYISRFLAFTAIWALVTSVLALAAYISSFVQYRFLFNVTTGFLGTYRAWYPEAALATFLLIQVTLAAWALLNRRIGLVVAPATEARVEGTGQTEHYRALPTLTLYLIGAQILIPAFVSTIFTLLIANGYTKSFLREFGFMVLILIPGGVLALLYWRFEPYLTIDRLPPASAGSERSSS